MTIRVDAHETEPSALMRKAERDERGPRGGGRGERDGRPPRDRDGPRPPRRFGDDRPPRFADDRPPREFRGE
jgi:small subunit ribosomal protein S6